MSERKEQISFLEKVLQTDSKAVVEHDVVVDEDDIAIRNKMKKVGGTMQIERVGLNYLAGDMND